MKTIRRRTCTSSNCTEQPPMEARRFWLYVAADGTEHRYAHRPDFGRPPTIEVIVQGDIETTHTRNIEYASGAFMQYTLVKPRGAGWEILNDSPDKWTAWQRKAVS